MSNRRRTRRPSAPHAQLKPGVYVLEIRHDDGCKAMQTQRMRDCTCARVDQVLKGKPMKPSGTW